MGQYYYIPDPGEQRGNFTAPIPDRLAQLRQNQIQQIPPNMMQPAPNLAQQPQAIVSGQQTAPAGAPQNSGIIWVSGKEEADKWPIAFGCAVALWDANNPVIYLRQADSTGKPSTKVYDLVERTDASPPPQPAPQVDLSRYVTIDQLEDILAERFKRPAKAAKVKEDTENG
ncbi:MAG: hypothetical protein OSJ58_09035 [Dysosmobacter sp.]|uniref:hypothetical protein n=1 Tax=uncultured Oscillibacter sp. TaxID=876091 RepID=UPI00261380F4|nr:hypothetical protein [uncultured Oscillibacter sp.]MCX4371962.1 hypothetical protein [Dysosmobacter sp.]